MDSARRAPHTEIHRQHPAAWQRGWGPVAVWSFPTGDYDTGRYCAPRVTRGHSSGRPAAAGVPGGGTASVAVLRRAPACSGEHGVLRRTRRAPAATRQERQGLW